MSTRSTYPSYDMAVVIDPALDEFAMSDVEFKAAAGLGPRARLEPTVEMIVGRSLAAATRFTATEPKVGG